MSLNVFEAEALYSSYSGSGPS